MKRCGWLAACALALGGCATPTGVGFPRSSSDSVPPRIAVSSFENRSGFDGQWQLGSGMADLLVSELVASRRFVVLERANLPSVVDELSRQREQMFRKEGRLDEGRLENARYLIRGVVTDFSQTGGGALWMAIRRLLIGSGGYTARVGLTLTIVEIESGRIVDSVQCSGKARAGSTFAQADYKGVQFGGRLFFQTPLGKATTSAVRQGLRKVLRSVPQQRWEPLIADVNGPRIMLNGGKTRGVRVGQRYRAREKGAAVTDPLTGDLLDVLPGRVVGTVEVVEVRDSIALAKGVVGSGFSRGQRLESVPTETRPQTGFPTEIDDAEHSASAAPQPES